MPERPGFLFRHAATLACGLATFLVVALLGWVGASFALARFTDTIKTNSSDDVAAIGTSVANALAQQFERALTYGVPLEKLPGIEAYLARTAHDIPGVARIVVRLSNGQELRADSESGNGDASRETVFAQLIADGVNHGQIEVLTDASELTGSLTALHRMIAPLVLGFATLAGLLAAFTVGAGVDSRRAELTLHLRRNAEGRFGEGSPVPMLRGRDRIARTFRALRNGEQHVLEEQAAVEAYAEELLGVDFDDQLRPRIEAAVRSLHGRTAAPGAVREDGR
ncbi:hypothetical protein MWN34_10470 [Ancylobacter sp. 6x-1]|uniref:HAMP domain-containing protein n=1 Tax=Ancylobacter crimeensis TaxID=2579147 RepID=A0ABT0DBJ9_9HYPH|nr:hypothetical protein [Ancylobacter crimeensis]MCK0197336.1 hypothetical protein [Ancylobacter crimeensis]